jgi:hypothetical protein
MGASGGYKFSQTARIQFLDSSQQTIWKTQHLMTDTTRRHTRDGPYGRSSLPVPEATLQPYSPEHEHGNVPPPPRCVPEVSVCRCIAFISSVTILFSRLHLPCTVPAMPLSGMRPRCIRVSRTSAMVCPCHMSTMWLATIVFGLTHSRVLLLLRRRRALPSLERFRRPNYSSHLECCGPIQEPESKSRHRYCCERPHDLPTRK